MKRYKVDEATYCFHVPNGLMFVLVVMTHEGTGFSSMTFVPCAPREAAYFTANLEESE